MIKDPEKGDTIEIIDEKLPNYGEKYILMFKPYHGLRFWSYGNEVNVKSGIALGIIGEIQFKIIYK
jgi:hypothetical protein